MTPREKAHELFEKFCKVETFTNSILITRHEARQAALIAADEVLNTLYEYHYDTQSGAYEFWNEVKKQIIII